MVNLNDLGITGNAAPASEYETLILGIANDVTQKLREAVLSKASNSGALAQSVAYFPTGVLSFEIQADDYYNFIDEGVNALPKKEGYTYRRALMSGSPFSFRYNGVGNKMASAIQRWKGGDMRQAFATAYSIKRHGIQARNITGAVFTEELLQGIAEDLTELTGLQFDVTFTRNTKSWQ